MKKVLALVLALVMAFSCTVAFAEAPALRRNEIVRVGFTAAVAGFTWSPLLIARNLGYFNDEGIDLVFDQSYSSSATRMVAANQVEFSTPGPHLTAAGIASGMDIKSVFQWFPVDIFGLIVMADSGITSYKDLEGKKIASMSPTTKNQILPILEAAGVDTTTVEIIPVGDQRLQQLVAGNVDAAFTWDGEWQQWKAEGQDIAYLSGEEVYDSQSNSIIASTALIEQYPDLIGRFCRALAKGCYFCYVNPKAAADIILTEWTSLQVVGMENAQTIVETAVNFMTGGKEVMEGNTIGQHSTESWELMMRDYVKFDIVPQAVEIEKCFTNQFVEMANDWDRAVVEADAGILLLRAGDFGTDAQNLLLGKASVFTLCTYKLIKKLSAEINTEYTVFSEKNGKLPRKNGVIHICKFLSYIIFHNIL